MSPLCRCRGLLLYLITLKHTHSAEETSWRKIGLSQRPLPDNTHSHETDIHASGGIRTRNPNKRAAAELRLTGVQFLQFLKLPTNWHRVVTVVSLHHCTSVILQTFFFINPFSFKFFHYLDMPDSIISWHSCILPSDITNSERVCLHQDNTATKFYLRVCKTYHGLLS